MDSEHNVALINDISLGHPLGPVHPSMHWGWAAGYRFLALEGYSGTNLDAQSQVHALEDNNFFHQTHAVVGEAFNGALSLSLDANYEYMFEGLPVSEGFFVHGSTGIASETMVNMKIWFLKPVHLRALLTSRQILGFNFSRILPPKGLI